MLPLCFLVPCASKWDESRAKEEAFVNSFCKLFVYMLSWACCLMFVSFLPHFVTRCMFFWQSCYVFPIRESASSCKVFRDLWCQKMSRKKWAEKMSRNELALFCPVNTCRCRGVGLSVGRLWGLGLSRFVLYPRSPRECLSVLSVQLTHLTHLTHLSSRVFLSIFSIEQK